MSAEYDDILADLSQVISAAKLRAVRAVNSLMTATYWMIGRRVVDVEQGGQARADYGDVLLKRLGKDLTSRFGRGFGWRNLFQMRAFYLAYPDKLQTSSAIFDEARSFPLPWSHYVKLLGVEDPKARAFYETEALRGGWTVRQLHRQIVTQFYERTLLAKNPAAVLANGQVAVSDDSVTPDEEIKDPLVLEFLNLKDEYSESDLEDALIHEIESFLLELGGDFSFIGRQRRLRVDDAWYRVDLLFFHRRLRSLILIDLKLGEFTPADAGQMYLYCNYAREHWTLPGENPPVGLILCRKKNATVAHYALDGLPNKIMAAEYLRTLPDEKVLEAKLQNVARRLSARGQALVARTDDTDD